MQTGHLILVVAMVAMSYTPHLLISSADNMNTAHYTELKNKWERLSQNTDVDQQNPPPSTRYHLMANNTRTVSTDVDTQGEQANLGPQISESLLAWISNQCENMIEEIEAISKQNAVSETFSAVNYLRYLFLYQRLTTITRQPYKELKWVKKKIFIFSSAFQKSLELLRGYLEYQNDKLMNVENAEPKGKQVGVSDSWMEHYLNIRYIAIHAPKQSELTQRAIELLSYSPDNNPLRQRSARFEVKVRAFSR